MQNKPEFTIVAGANGAGKSTLKNEYVRPGTLYFDGDFVFARLQKQYPQLSRESLGGGVAVSLENTVNQVIEERKNFAFETNFSTDMAINLTNKFRENGFSTNLVYIGIDSLEMSKQRVTDRVLTGGHNVEDAIIDFNFNEGKKRVGENLSLFDNILFINNKELGKNEVIALFKKDLALKEVLSPNVEWFNANFKDSFLKLDFHNGLSHSKGLKI